MFLKSLELKGFKSFAEKTTLEFQPGVCVVVGPNGSGKSNIVDAVAWVLGAQGARQLRGAKMDDVIFAGTAERPALGRAEVTLTIDNTSRLLPIEFSEVTITRTLFRTGESEYALNGAPCRLLDIQELLSDSGIGRQQHVIVSQGQLDGVLTARPEDRRSIIEEAAGILKFRKRKEKAERRLQSTEASLLRLGDLLREVRRGLRPLERQADAARRHDGIAEELRAIRLHLAGREIDRLRDRELRRADARRALAVEEQDTRVRLRGFDTQVSDAERALAGPGDDDVADLLARTEALRERTRGLTRLVAERRRGLERDLAAVADEDVVASLVAEAAAVRDRLTEARSEIDGLVAVAESVAVAEAEVGVLEAGGSPAEARAALAAARRELDEITRRAAEGAAEHEAATNDLARVRSEQAALGPERAAADAAAAEVARLRAALGAPDAPDGPTALAERRLAVETELEVAEEARRTAETEASRWRARADTLAIALDEAHAAAGGTEIAAVPGVLGPLVDLLEIEEGAEVAVAAALGDALRAIVVGGDQPLRDAVERLERGDHRALLLPTSGSAPTSVAVPSGTRPLADCVRTPAPGVDTLVERLLAGTVLVDGGWERALDVALADPDLVVLTVAGDRFGGSGPWRVGASGTSAVTPAALADAMLRAEAAERTRDEASVAVTSARSRLDEARRAERESVEADRRHREQLERAATRAAEQRRAVDVRSAALEERETALVARLAALEGAAVSLPAAEADARAAVVTAESVADAAGAHEEQLRAARVKADELRRDLERRRSTTEERTAVYTARLTEIEARLAARPDEEARARAHREAIEARRRSLDEAARRLAARTTETEALAERLWTRRREQSEAAREAGARLDRLRADRAGAERALGEVRERVGRLEIEEAEIRLRLEQAVEAVRRDFDCEPDHAVATEAPPVVEGTSLPNRARELEREIRLMGPINPLALSEYESLLERHEFLQRQLDDVKETRRELNRVIRGVDEEIVRVFDAAFTDVAQNFSALFSTLFPGGSGRLVLTNPDDLLNTGIEMEARPSGKTVRRLSLLSGGERSLCALAYLFAVFRSRPSPFYLMDEVEAALDDINLHRFVELVHEFRTEAQLLIVSHQKRTMEAADVLYGVSMPPGGSSRVVSQRLQDVDFEGADATPRG